MVFDEVCMDVKEAIRIIIKELALLMIPRQDEKQILSITWFIKVV